MRSLSAQRALLTLAFALALLDNEPLGRVHLVPAPGWLLASDGDSLASMHGTPHRYDTDVAPEADLMRFCAQRRKRFACAAAT